MLHREATRSAGRKAIAALGLAGVLALAAIGLTQCRMVDDTVTGVDLKTSATSLHGGSDCVRDCRHQYKACKRAEEKVHKANAKACRSLGSSAERKACMKAERVRHNDAKDSCRAAKQVCKKGCYNEGAGNLGS